MMVLSLVLVLIFNVGCGEDSVDPETNPFNITLTVSNPIGEPVAGLVATLQVVIPGAGPDAAKAAANIGFSLPVTAAVTITVYDMEDNLVSTLFDRVAIKGGYQAKLRTYTDGTPLVGTGLFRYEMVAVVSGVEQFRQSRYMTLYTSFERSLRPVLGVTDLMGRLSDDDQTLFPFLYGMGPQMFVNENAEIAGAFDFDETVVISLTDPDSGRYLDFDVVIRQGHNAVELVWDEALTIKPRELKNPPTWREFMALTDTSNAEEKFVLGLSYPNPFN